MKCNELEEILKKVKLKDELELVLAKQMYCEYFCQHNCNDDKENNNDRKI